MILKSVNQPNVENSSDCVSAINGGSAVLQHVDVINQPNRKHVEVDGATEKGIEPDCITGKTVRRETPSILQDKGFFGGQDRADRFPFGHYRGYLRFH